MSSEAENLVKVMKLCYFNSVGILIQLSGMLDFPRLCSRPTKTSLKAAVLCVSVCLDVSVMQYTEFHRHKSCVKTL